MSGVRKGRIQDRIKALQEARDLLLAQYEIAIKELMALLEPEPEQSKPSEKPKE
jgi:hypothetical protein